MGNEVYQTERDEEDRAAAVAGTSQRNRPSVGYNIVDHNWGDGAGAERLKFTEDSAKWRASQRANELYQKSNNPGHYNILTGQPLTAQVEIPPTPVMPAPFNTRR
eukprot:NODE_1995_length_790_cov_64.476383_g1586_i0.p2 GENE.NODE_1995_length_790_cov_64.476383_g1586_i0~~NODE_1995_length_790_cov_64.476383_g1586_i0.p2  ORF type:complete len:105 (-),score=10.91 NODE_1995_length_790_cov_64.476383_g1586_i0:68-382(-)